MTSIFAAAGIAEGAWATAACMMVLGLGIVGVVTLLALALRSLTLAAFAAVLLLFATLLFKPWYGFAPFSEAAYADPDVESAAGMFRTVAVIWVVTCVATTASLLVAFFTPPKDPAVAAAVPEGVEGRA